jgi:DNA-binding transcriptional ArsR family regulator
MPTAIDTAVELLGTRQNELVQDREKIRVQLREIESELTRIDAAVKSLRGRPERSPSSGPSKARAGSVKDVVVQALRDLGSMSPAELSEHLVDGGQLESGREGSIRTALWQLRKDGLVDTDPQGRSRLVGASV